MTHIHLAVTDSPAAPNALVTRSLDDSTLLVDELHHAVDELCKKLDVDPAPTAAGQPDSETLTKARLTGAAQWLHYAADKMPRGPESRYVRALGEWLTRGRQGDRPSPPDRPPLPEESRAAGFAEGVRFALESTDQVAADQVGHVLGMLRERGSVDAAQSIRNMILTRSSTPLADEAARVALEGAAKRAGVLGADTKKADALVEDIRRAGYAEGIRMAMGNMGATPEDTSSTAAVAHRNGRVSIQLGRQVEKIQRQAAHAEAVKWSDMWRDVAAKFGAELGGERGTVIAEDDLSHFITKLIKTELPYMQRLDLRQAERRELLIALGAPEAEAEKLYRSRQDTVARLAQAIDAHSELLRLVEITGAKALGDAPARVLADAVFAAAQSEPTAKPGMEEPSLTGLWNMTNDPDVTREQRSAYGERLGEKWISQLDKIFNVGGK